jgi:transposase
MDHFAGLDVSVKETSICIVDDTGKIVGEAKVASEPDALLQVLKNGAYHFKRIGLEAGPLSQWLFSALAEAGLSAICVETRHMRAVCFRSGISAMPPHQITQTFSSHQQAGTTFLK